MRRGIEQGEYVYRRGDLLFGPGDPPAAIEIDEQSMLFTMAYAKNTGIWPRQSVEHQVLRRLSRAGVKLGRRVGAMKQGHALTEDLALALGLLFRTLAPMRSRENMRAVAEGIEAMGREEAAYWLGMAMHRKNPRRVLTALRILLTVPGATRRRS